LPRIQAGGFTVYGIRIEQEIEQQVLLTGQFRFVCLTVLLMQNTEWEADHHAKFSRLQLASMPKAQHRVFDGLEAGALAEQLTLFDLQLFRNVLSVEYVNHLKRRPNAGQSLAASLLLDCCTLSRPACSDNDRTLGRLNRQIQSRG